MAKETKKPAEAAETKTEKDGIRENNLISDVLALDAFKEIEKENDEKKKREAKEAICAATYSNAKTRAQLRARRREDEITKEKLTATKDLLERTIGVCTDIKDGKLIPTKETVPQDQRLTLSEYKEERDKLEKKIREKMSESERILRADIDEIRNSLEVYYVSWWDR